MSIIDQKITTTQFITQELSKYAEKVNFIPDNALIDSMRYLEETGIPNAKHEDYKYCNVEAIFKKDFKSITNTFTSIGKEVASNYKTIDNAINLFIINGKFESDFSDLANLPKGLTVKLISAIEKSVAEKHLTKYANVLSDAFIALNTAYAGNGIFIEVEKNAVIETPIHIINLVSSKENVFYNVRNLVVANTNSQLTFVETFETLDLPGKSFNNYLTEVFVGENAIVDTYRIQNECEHGYQVNTTQVYQSKQSNYTTSTFSLGGQLVRNNLNVVIDAEHAESNLNGLFLADKTQLIDNHTLVDHQKPNCNSNELYKGIVRDKSTGVFNGKIYVRKDAQKTNAYQSSKNILLSDDATINTKPQLEIYADDVKCSHGTSTGKIDDEALFYLKARGIGEESGRLLLMQAFAGEVTERIKIESLQNHIQNLIDKKLK